MLSFVMNVAGTALGVVFGGGLLIVGLLLLDSGKAPKQTFGRVGHSED